MRHTMDHLSTLKQKHAQLQGTRTATHRALLDLREKVKDHETTVAYLDGKIQQSAETLSMFEPPLPPEERAAALAAAAAKTAAEKKIPSKK